MLRANTTSALNILKVEGNALKRNHVLQISAILLRALKTLKILELEYF